MTWESTPIKDRLVLNITEVLPNSPEQRDRLEQDIMDNLTPDALLTTQELHNISMTWLRYVDHAFGGNGPSTFLPLADIIAHMPEEPLQSVRPLKLSDWLFFIVMQRASSGVELLHNGTQWLFKRVKSLRKLATAS